MIPAKLFALKSRMILHTKLALDMISKEQSHVAGLLNTVDCCVWYGKCKTKFDLCVKCVG